MDDGRINDIGKLADDVVACEDPYVASFLRRSRHRAALCDSLRFLESFEQQPARPPFADVGVMGGTQVDERSWRFPQRDRLNGPRLDATD